MSRSASSTLNKKISDRNKSGKKKEEIIESSSSDDDDQPLRVPLQLKLEFVNSIMFRQWVLAKKLCHFMLMYEPNNSEAKQYAPLIDYMLANEESSSSDDDDTSDNEDSSDSSTSDSSADEEQKANHSKENQSPKPVNGSLSHKYANHN